VSETPDNWLRVRAIQATLSFICLAFLATQVQSPWWEGPILEVKPEWPEPSSGFVAKQPTEEVEEVAKVDLAPSDKGAGKRTEDESTDGTRPDKDPASESAADSDTGASERDGFERIARLGPAEIELIDNVEQLSRELPETRTDLDRPCLRWQAAFATDGPRPVCMRRAMDPFFEQLRRVALKRADRPVRFSQLGDSLIAGDGFTGELRRLLHEQFGDGGFGWIYPGKASQYIGTRHLSVRYGGDWNAFNVVMDGPNAARYGFPGVAFEPKRGPTVGIYPHDEGTGRTFDRVGLVYWRPYSSLELRMALDGSSRRVDLSGAAQRHDATWVSLGESKPHRLRLSDFRSAATYYGIILENRGPGAVVDNMGLMNGRAPRLSLVDPATWRRHISLRGSDVVSFAYGVNSAGKKKASDEWLDDYQRQYGQVLRRTRRARSKTSCLVVGVLSRGTLQGGRVQVYPSVVPLLRHQRAAALENGCAFWNAFRAIGGEEGMNRWYHNSPRLLGSDFAHPTGAGYTKLANLFYSSVIDAFQTYLEERQTRLLNPGIETFSPPRQETPSVFRSEP